MERSREAGALRHLGARGPARRGRADVLGAFGPRSRPCNRPRRIARWRRSRSGARARSRSSPRTSTACISAPGRARVVEYHGTCNAGCASCAVGSPSPVRPTCPRAAAQVLRPDIVLFGEAIPLHAEHEVKGALRDCDLFVAIGTSGTVWPAAAFVRSAAYAGARTVLLNLEIDDESRDATRSVTPAPPTSSCRVGSALSCGSRGCGRRRPPRRGGPLRGPRSSSRRSLRARCCGEGDGGETFSGTLDWYGWPSTIGMSWRVSLTMLRQSERSSVSRTSSPCPTRRRARCGRCDGRTSRGPRARRS